jgi:hypothetical protein
MKVTIVVEDMVRRRRVGEGRRRIRRRRATNLTCKSK